jgi:transcriptional regulator with XRE-family HTH domain
MATNVEIAERLGLNHSMVSRLRIGERVGSVDVLSRISSEYNVPLGPLVDAAVKARAGDSSEFVSILEEAFSREEAQAAAAS